MPYVSIHIDADKVLREIDDDDLRIELASRSRKRGDETQMISRNAAKATLDESAHRLRKIGRFDLAFRLDEIKTDYF